MYKTITYGQSSTSKYFPESDKKKASTTEKMSRNKLNKQEKDVEQHVNHQSM